MSDELTDNVELYPPWKEALKAFERAGFTYGDLITKDWFVKAIGMEPLGDRMMSERDFNRHELAILQQFKPFRDKVLEQYQMDLVSDRAGAYIVIAPKDQPERAYRDMSSGIERELRRALSRMRNVNTARLTAEERQRAMDTYAKAAALAHAMTPRKRLPFDDDRED